VLAGHAATFSLAVRLNEFLSFQTSPFTAMMGWLSIGGVGI
jgi:hypothetical protein